MATLTASPAIKAAAAKRGLADLSRGTTAKLAAAPTPVSRRTTMAPATVHRHELLLKSEEVSPAPEPAAALEPAEPKPPSKKQQKSAEFMAHRRALQMAARERIWPTLKAVFPMAFPLPPTPLAIGIHHQILEIAAGEIDPADLSAFLRYWCSRRSYLIAVWRGMGRRNLDGSIAGVPTLDQRNDAGRGVWGDRYRPIEEPVGGKVEAA